MDDDLRDRARELRLAGRSCRQIAEELEVTQRVAERWVAGLPVPEWTRRPQAKDEARARARALRVEGWSYKEIAEELGVSRSSCSLWLRDLPRPTGEAAGRYPPERVRAMRRGRWEKILRRRQQERLAQTSAASREIGDLSRRELLIAGAILYWAEGSKSKPWRRSEAVAFINSDPRLVRLFLAWLRTLGVGAERLTLRVQIHQTADAAAAVRYWADVTGVPSRAFARTTLKRHQPKTVRKNVGDSYRGCVVVTVHQGAELYRRIEGWVAGIVDGALSFGLGGDTVGSEHG